MDKRPALPHPPDTMDKRSTRPAAKGPGGRPSRERVAQIAQLILSATARAFAEEGSTFTMERVAELAGVSKQAIYRRWASKEDLLLASIELGMARLRSMPEGDKEGDAAALLRDCAWRLACAAAHRDTQAVLTFLKVEAIRGEAIGASLALWRQQASTPFITLLDRLALQGQLSPVGTQDAANVLFDLMMTGGERNASERMDERAMRAAFDLRWAIFARAFLVNP